MSASEIEPADANPGDPWIHVVGMGDDGWDGLPSAAQNVIQATHLLIGGRRHLALLADLKKPTMCWPKNLAAFVDRLDQFRRKRPVVVASGDPCEYGVAPSIVRAHGRAAVTIIPAPSARVLMCARLGWEVQATRLLSFTRVSLACLAGALAPGERLILYCTPSTPPDAVAAFLCDYGYGLSEIHVFSHIGGQRDSVRTVRASELAREPMSPRRSGPEDPSPLVSLAVICRSDPAAVARQFAGGLDDSGFTHDGQITRRHIRAMALADLDPAEGRTVWDVGAGAGSVVIAWLRLAPNGTGVAFECHGARARAIRSNARRHGVAALEVVEGHAPQTFAGHRGPHAVFIGGGLRSGVLSPAMDALRPGGVLLAHAVCLESESILIRAARAQGGQLTRVSLCEADALRSVTVWRPAMPLTRWMWRKP